MSDFVSDLENALQTIGKNIHDWFSSIWDILTQEAKAIISQGVAIGSGLASLGNSIVNAFVSAYEKVKEAFDTLGSWVHNAFNTFGSWIHGGLDRIKEGLTTAYDYLRNAINTFADYFHKAYDTIGNWIHQAFDTLGDWLHKAHNVLGSWLSEGMSYIKSGLDTIGTIIGSGISTLGNYLHTAWNTFSSYVKGAWDYFSQNLYNFGHWLWNGLQWVGGYVWGGLSYLGQCIHNFGQWIWNSLCWAGSQLVNGFNWIGRQVYNIGHWLWNGVKYVLDGIINLITNAFNTVYDWILDGVHKILGWWGSLVGSANSWYQSIISTIRDKIYHIVFNDVLVTLGYKCYEKIPKAKSLRDVGFALGGIFMSPVIAHLVATLFDKVIPKPSSTTTDGAVFHFMPQLAMMQAPTINKLTTQLTEPTKPDMGNMVIPEFTFEKPQVPSLINPNVNRDVPVLGQPLEVPTETVEYTGGNRTIVVNETPVRLGDIGTKIKSVTVKAPVTNTSRIWLSISEEEPTMTRDNVFILYPGEAIDIAIDDLGKVWVRSEQGTQEVSYIYIKLKQD